MYRKLIQKVLYEFCVELSCMAIGNLNRNFLAFSWIITILLLKAHGTKKKKKCSSFACSPFFIKGTFLYISCHSFIKNTLLWVVGLFPVYRLMNNLTHSLLWRITLKQFYLHYAEVNCKIRKKFTTLFEF